MESIKQYKSVLSLRETQIAIKKVKDFFQDHLAAALTLTRVSAPLFVSGDSGINDNLNGVERPVHFDIKAIPGVDAQIVHSLAKWKRYALKEYGFKPYEGLYTDMNAIRRDEDLDRLHSLYVDQWDWEKVILKEDRNEDMLKETVRKIYGVFKETEIYVNQMYPEIEKILPEDIFFITTQELEDMYPDMTPREREDAITRDKKAVFLMQIGKTLASGKKHDGRSPDYDDWTLNGDILLYYPLYDGAVELSSMGIRVDEETLLKQLKLSHCEDREKLPFHKALLQGELPYTMGGGIGQSRICLFFLRKAHIGEVQSSLWSREIIESCKKAGIHLL